MNLSGTPENSFKSYLWKPPNLVAFLVHHIHAIALTGDHWLVAAKRRRARMSEVPVPLPAIRLEIASPRWVLLLSAQVVSIHDIENAGFLQDMIELPHSRIPPRLSFGSDIQAGIALSSHFHIRKLTALLMVHITRPQCGNRSHRHSCMKFTHPGRSRLRE